MYINNIVNFLMLLTITVILLSGCSTNANKKVKNFPVSIIKKIITGLD